MRKNITKIFLAASLVALVLTSCTDEADVLDNKPIKNKKTLTQPTIDRPYPEYEETDMSSSEAIQLVSRFDKAMKGDSAISTIDVTNAVLALETYFNYGVVAKQEIVDTTAYYTGSNFQFEVNIDGQGNINGAELVDAYTTFLNNFLQQMNGKYLQYSDLFVKAIGNGKVMFALEIPSFTEYDRILWQPHQFRILKPETGPFDIPVNYTIDVQTLHQLYGVSVDHARLSEACVTTIDGFGYGQRIFTRPCLETVGYYMHTCLNTYIIGSQVMVDDILPGAIESARQYVCDDLIHNDLLISSTYRIYNNVWYESFVNTKVRMSNLDSDILAYEWNILDQIIF